MATTASIDDSTRQNIREAAKKAIRLIKWHEFQAIGFFCSFSVPSNLQLNVHRGFFACNQVIRNLTPELYRSIEFLSRERDVPLSLATSEDVAFIWSDENLHTYFLEISPPFAEYLKNAKHVDYLEVGDAVVEEPIMFFHYTPNSFRFPEGTRTSSTHWEPVTIEGRITQVNSNKILHNARTNLDCRGLPLLNCEAKVVGIHFGHDQIDGPRGLPMSDLINRLDTNPPDVSMSNDGLFFFLFIICLMLLFYNSNCSF